MSLGRPESLWITASYYERVTSMTKVLAGITTSVDGYITGPDDGPGEGLGGSSGDEFVRLAPSTSYSRFRRPLWELT